MQQPRNTEEIKADDLIPVHDTTELLGSDGRAFLRHDGAIYTLRVTRNGKLILTK